MPVTPCYFPLWEGVLCDNPKNSCEQTRNLHANLSVIKSSQVHTSGGQPESELPSFGNLCLLVNKALA